MTALPVTVQGLVWMTVTAAAVIDLRSKRVPNWLTTLSALLAVGLNFYAYGTPGILLSLKGAGLALLFYLPLYLLHAMGAGDVKLIGAVGAAVGPENSAVILLLTAFFAALSALVVIARTRSLRWTLGNVGAILRSGARLRLPYEEMPALDVAHPEAIAIPHAVAIALGAGVFLLPGLLATCGAAVHH